MCARGAVLHSPENRSRERQTVKSSVVTDSHAVCRILHTSARLLAPPLRLYFPSRFLFLALLSNLLEIG
jgi:hypothetical protein